jgi:WhiB family redox-sensing transcriptional regulator
MKAVTAELRRLRQARQQPRVPRLPWAAHAAGKGHEPEDWMDDRPGRPTAAARAVCAACPVGAACLAHALAYDEPWGVWGGLTTRERLAGRLGLPVHGDDPGFGDALGYFSRARPLAHRSALRCRDLEVFPK